MWEELKERLAEALATPWEPVSPVGLAALMVFFLGVALIQAFSRQHWVPLLDSINLVFHESGHPVFGILGWEVLTILGGTLMQLLVPLLVAGSFFWKRRAESVAFGLFWFFQNFHNIARYMADARAGLLPLVGGGEHDWQELFVRWGCLRQDTAIACGLTILGWAGMAGTAGWLVWRYARPAGEARYGRQP